MADELMGCDAAGMLDHYSAALDALHRERVAAAAEAWVIHNALGYSTIPKGARDMLTGARNRLLAVAQGRAEHVYADMTNRERQAAIRDAQMPATLTRQQWEARKPTKRKAEHDQGVA